MPLNERNFKINIETQADLTGAKQTLAALESDTEAAKRMGLAIGDSERQISSLRSQIQSFEKTAGAAAKEEGKLALSHHDMKIAARELLETGGLGELRGLLHGMFEPEALGVFAAVEGFQAFTEALDKMKQKAAEAVTAIREMADSIRDAHITAMIDAEKANADFQARLDAVGRSQDAATHAMQRSIAILSEETKHTEALIDAQERLYEARTREAVERGQMTPTEGDQHIQDLQRQAQKKKDEAEDAQTSAEIAAKRGRVSDAQAEIDADNAQLPAKKNRSEQMAESIGLMESRKKRFDDQLKKAQDAADKAQAAYDTASHTTSLAQTGTDQFGAPVFSQVQNDAKQAEAKAEADRALAAAQFNVDQITKSIAQMTVARQRVEDQIKALEDEIVARKELTQNLAREANEIEADLQHRQKNRAEEERLQTQIQETTNRSARETRIHTGKASPDDISTEQGYNAGQANANSATRALESRFEMARRNAAQNLPGSKEELHSMLEQAIGIMEAVHEQQTNGRTGNAALASRLNALAARLDDSRWSHH